jgi:SAM-dependent methyltransferase
MPQAVQSQAELDEFWQTEDPWGFRTNKHDAVRVAELLSALPERTYDRTLDIGCGDGFLTFNLPGKEVVGIELAERALGWARKTADSRPDGARFRFVTGSIFDLPLLDLGRFDLIVITGVLYPQYIGDAFSVIDATVQDSLAEDGILATAHIREWYGHGFSLLRLHRRRYRYREYEHLLEVYSR